MDVNHVKKELNKPITTNTTFAYLELQNFQMYWIGLLSRHFHKCGQKKRETIVKKL